MSRPESELSSLLRLAIPLAVAHAGNQLMGAVDTAVVGRVGATELAAVGLGNSLYFAISMLAIGTTLGIDPLIAQAVGAGDLERSRRLLWQGIWLAIGVGTATMIPMALSPWLLPLFGVKASIIPLASTYVWIRTASIIPMLIYMVARAYLQALGITRPIVTAMLLANLCNLLANIYLVFGGRVLPGWMGPLRNMPALGVAGSAMATVGASLLQVGLIAIALRRHGAGSPASDVAPERETLGRALHVGLPVGLHMAAEVGIFALVGLLAGTMGANDLAAHQIAITLASFTFTIVVGIGSAASVRVGQAIGRGDAAGTRRAGLVAFGAGGLFMALAASSFVLVPGALARLLSNSPEVLAATVPLLAVAAVFQISDGIQGIGAGVLRGTGDTRFTFVANMIGHWAIGLPVALFMGLHLKGGIVGLWWGLCAGLTAVAVMLFVRFLQRSKLLIEPL